MKKKRLDEILIAKGWVKDKNEAFVVVTEGRVFIEGQKAVSPAQLASPDMRIEVRAERKYVGRGAQKLAGALEKFHVDPENKVCADIGSATGGFTQVLLEAGAKKVYAIDTAKGKLALRIREDPRVVVMEETDVRDLESLPEPVEIVTIDVSLIPLQEILPAVRRFLSRPLRKGRGLSKEGVVIALFKPQYQTRDAKVLHHGVVKDAKERERLLDLFRQWGEERGWKVVNQMESPIRGSEGNVEYLLYLKCSP